MLVTVAVAIVAVSLVGNLVSVSVGGTLGSILRAGATSLGLFLVFYPMYYIFPDTDVTPLEVVPGVAFAAVGLTVAQTLFVAFKAGSAGANIVASILILLTWLYIVGLVVLLGAVINAVLSNRSEDVDIAPVVGEGEAPGAPTAAVGRAHLLDELDGLAATLPDGESVTITVGDESVRMAPPGAVSVDRESSVFGLDDSVALTLRWWPDEDYSSH
jgi:membrane protein